jgi:hypothetical protein
VSFLVVLLTFKKLLMNHLYHKLVLASIGTALSFTLVANQEAKAATFTLQSRGVSARDINGDGIIEYSDNVPFYLGSSGSLLYEFNIGSLPLTSNRVVSSAILQATVDIISQRDGYFHTHIFSYRGSGRPETSNYQSGTYLTLWDEPRLRPNFSFNVTSSVNSLLSNNDAFVGFRISGNEFGNVILSRDVSLIITTEDVAEPVPEPTTIFGSALALSLGGWLKRKKSS